MAPRLLHGLPKLRSAWAGVRGHRIHARVGPAVASGLPPVVLVHGLGVSGRYMVPTARRLARHTRVLVPDLPGFGRSSKPDRALDVPELAAVLEQWSRAAGLERAAFVGNSFGCQVAVELALRRPDRVTHLVLAGPTADPHRATVPQQIGRAALDVVLEPPRLWPIVLTDYLRAGLGRCLRTLDHLLADPVAAKLPAVEAPALVVRGAWDPIVPPAWTREAAALLPHGRAAEVPHAAHAINFNSPDLLVRATLRFLAEPSGRRTWACGSGNK